MLQQGIDECDRKLKWLQQKKRLYESKISLGDYSRETSLLHTMFEGLEKDATDKKSLFKEEFLDASKKGDSEEEEEEEEDEEKVEKSSKRQRTSSSESDPSPTDSSVDYTHWVIFSHGEKDCPIVNGVFDTLKEATKNVQELRQGLTDSTHDTIDIAPCVENFVHGEKCPCHDCRSAWEED